MHWYTALFWHQDITC